MMMTMSMTTQRKVIKGILKAAAKETRCIQQNYKKKSKTNLNTSVQSSIHRYKCILYKCTYLYSCVSFVSSDNFIDDKNNNDEDD